MSTRPISRSRLLAKVNLPAPVQLAILAVAVFAAPQQAAHAGCLDWLFGRPTQAAYYPPPATYSAGYAPTYSAGYAAAYPPSYAAGYPPVTSGVVQAQRPAYGMGTTVPVQTFDNPSVYTGLPTTTEVQRLPVNSAPAYSPPAYSTPINNTIDSYRLPVTSSPSVPIESTLRGGTSINPIVSPTYSANYPSTVAASGYNAPTSYNVQTSYSPAYGGTPAVLPVAPAPRWTFGSGLRRFFNSLLGSDTNYTTSYYTAPITYYRPASTVDPISGTTVTVQRPCSSYVQQLQRVPYNSFQSIQSTPLPSTTMPSSTLPSTTVPGTIAPDTCSPSMLGNALPPTGYPSTTTPGTFAPPDSGIGQVGGEYPPSGEFVAPIPSTIPEGPANTAPLTGNAPLSGARDPSDQQNVPQPRLEVQSERPDLALPPENNPPSSSDQRGSEADRYNDSYYRNDSQNGTSPNGGNGSDGNGIDEDEPAIRLDPPVSKRYQSAPPATPLNGPDRFTQSTPQSLQSNEPASSGFRSYSTLRPIGIPSQGESNRVPPFTGSESQSSPPPSTNPFDKRRETAPEPPALPPASSPPADASGLFRESERSAAWRDRVTVPVREATTRSGEIRQVAAWEESLPQLPPAAPPQTQSRRDTGGWVPAN